MKTDLNVSPVFHNLKDIRRDMKRSTIIELIKRRAKYPGIVIMILTAFVFGRSGCDIDGDNAPVNVKLVLDANDPAEQVIRYEIYWWQGDDTTSTVLQKVSESLATPDSIVSNYYRITYNYVKAGAVAVNNQARSEMGVSRIYSYFEFQGPQKPENLRIK
jgi:hypothetical protein